MKPIHILLCYLLWTILHGQNANIYAQSIPDTLPLFTPIETDFDCTTVTEIPQIECETLVAIYNATNGANWNTGIDFFYPGTPLITNVKQDTTYHIRLRTHTFPDSGDMWNLTQQNELWSTYSHVLTTVVQRNIDVEQNNGGVEWGLDWFRSGGICSICGHWGYSNY